VPKVIDFGTGKVTNHSLTEETLFTGFQPLEPTDKMSVLQFWVGSEAKVCPTLQLS